MSVTPRRTGEIQADAEVHVREVEEAVQAQRGKLLAQLSARDREIQASATSSMLVREAIGLDRVAGYIPGCGSCC